MGLLNSNTLNQWFTQTIPQNARNLWGEIKQAPQDMRNMFTPETYKKTMDAYKNPKNGALDKDKAMAMAMDFLQTTNPVAGLLAHTVYHGSPHKFNKFDMSKIGTGEGAQAYGHGLYMAESPEVAKQYQKQLSNDGFMVGDKVFNPSTLQHLNIRTMATRGDLDGAIEKAKQIAGSDSPVASMAMQDLTQLESIKQLGGFKQNQGAFYKVDIPDEAIPRMLDWDKPLSEQTLEVQKALEPAIKNRIRKYVDIYGDDRWMSSFAGQQKPFRSEEDAFNYLKEIVGTRDAYDMLGQPAEVSKQLALKGIPGIRYKDAMSRGTDAGTSNFVLFDDQLPRILEINGQPTGLLSYADEAKNTKGLISEPLSMRQSTELGDVTLTESAKNPGQYQLTMWDGKLGQSKPVRDEQFKSRDEAIKAYKAMIGEK